MIALVRAVIQAWRLVKEEGPDDPWPTSRLAEALDALAEAAATEPAECPCCLGDPLTVCDRCGQHGCWAGVLMCGDADVAGTKQRPASSDAEGAPAEPTGDTERGAT